MWIAVYTLSIFSHDENKTTDLKISYILRWMPLFQLLFLAWLRPVVDLVLHLTQAAAAHYSITDDAIGLLNLIFR